MNQKLFLAVTQAENTVQIAKAFVETYCDQIPEGLGSLLIAAGYVKFFVILEKWERQKVAPALKRLGEIFGADEWTQEEKGSRCVWSKTVAGVEVRIDFAAEEKVAESLPVLAVA